MFPLPTTWRRRRPRAPSSRTPSTRASAYHETRRRVFRRLLVTGEAASAAWALVPLPNETALVGDGGRDDFVDVVSKSGPFAAGRALGLATARLDDVDFDPATLVHDPIAHASLYGLKFSIPRFHEGEWTVQDADHVPPTRPTFPLETTASFGNSAKKR